MLHGHPLLIDTFSQYGVGLFYALAGAFLLVPVTYGGLQAILSVGYVLEFAAVYGVLRASCRSQTVAVTGLALALVANLAFPSPLPYIAYPSIGPLRFGLPWLVVLAGVVCTRSPHRDALLRALMLATVAVAAVWSFETFVFCASAYVGVVATRLAFDSDAREGRLRRFFVEVTLALAVGVAAVVSASILTRALAGRWPDWPVYLDLTAAYSLRGFGALQIPAWSPGYLVAALYVVSAIGLVVLASRPTAAACWAPQLVAIGGATAYGATSFTYFLGRSSAQNLHHVAIPAVVVACAWFTVIQPPRDVGRRWVAVTAAAGAAWFGAALVVANTGAGVELLRSSPLGQGLRSPLRPVEQARALFRPGAPRPEVAESARLLRRHTTGGDRPVVLVRPDLLTSALLAGGYGNALPIVNGNQDRLIGERSFEAVSRAVEGLAPGTVVLTEDMFLARAPQSFFVDASRPATYRRYGDFYVARVLQEVRRRFALRVAERGTFGLVVVELGARR
jgi:hypothetical protein